MFLHWQTLRAAEAINARTIEAWTATTAAPDPTIVLGMVIRGTTTLLTEPVLLLRVTVLVVIFPVVENTHLGRTGRARPSFPLTPFLSKEEPAGALSRLEGTQEEHTDKHYGQDR